MPRLSLSRYAGHVTYLAKRTLLHTVCQ